MQLSLFSEGANQQAVTKLEQVKGVKVKRAKPTQIHVLSIDGKMAAHLFVLGNDRVSVTNPALAEFNLKFTKSDNIMTISDLITCIKNGEEY